MLGHKCDDGGLFKKTSRYTIFTVQRCCLDKLRLSIVYIRCQIDSWREVAPKTILFFIIIVPAQADIVHICIWWNYLLEDEVCCVWTLDERDHISSWLFFFFFSLNTQIDLKRNLLHWPCITLLMMSIWESFSFNAVVAPVYSFCTPKSLDSERHWGSNPPWKHCTVVCGAVQLKNRAWENHLVTSSISPFRRPLYPHALRWWLSQPSISAPVYSMANAARWQFSKHAN